MLEVPRCASRKTPGPSEGTLLECQRKKSRGPSTRRLARDDRQGKAAGKIEFAAAATEVLRSSFTMNEEAAAAYLPVLTEEAAVAYLQALIVVRQQR